MTNLSKTQLKELLELKLAKNFGIRYEDASETTMFRALSLVTKDLLTQKRVEYKTKVRNEGYKQVYYMSMEFLLGRSLRNHLYNMGILDTATEVVSDLGFDINKVMAVEPDAGLGNGGLGRLAAAYMDSLTALGYPAGGFSIRYDYGIFEQKIVDGWQMEMPDKWLDQGDVWFNKRSEVFEVKFGGHIDERWENGRLICEQKDHTTILAVPYDMNISGYGSDAVNVLRLWSAKAPVELDMQMFSRGEYVKAIEAKAMAEAISKVLYPADNHIEGKSLRLKQQYFFVSASIQSIIKKHLISNPDLSNLAEKVAIHINDTHPTLAIPELMRILLDDCGYSWSKAWHIVTNTFAYTNHTVLAEALEKWDVNLVKQIVPRIFSIIVEINNRYCADLMERLGDSAKVTRMSIIQNNQIHMALLCVCASHSVNGVSKLHSDIIKKDVFSNEYADTPHKFKNVTNGIAYRRWLLQANPGLTKLLEDTIGDGFKKNAAELINFNKFENDEKVIKQLAEIKKANKERFAKYIKTNFGTTLNTDSIFDVQVKRLHEYKRQHLNALNIIAEYNYLLENPDADFVPKTYIFAAKAAPGYYLAKQIIKMIWALGEEIRKNPKISEKLQVYFVENYCVSLSELIMPASEVSEQISLAGKEASGTGNMKFMLNGALTLGTLDGANVEIKEQVGIDNIFIFGMNADEVLAKQAQGYRPEDYCNNNDVINRAINRMYHGINGCTFEEVANSLKFKDPYMVLADFDAYQCAQQYVSECYKDVTKWNKMSLHNIAGAGIFSADRSVEDYARDIWKLH